MSRKQNQSLLLVTVRLLRTHSDRPVLTRAFIWLTRAVKLADSFFLTWNADKTGRWCKINAFLILIDSNSTMSRETTMAYGLEEVGP